MPRFFLYFKLFKGRVSSTPHVLLQCIGAWGDVVPEYSTGEYKEGDMFLICSDGFRHKLKKKEMESIFGDGFGSDEELKAAAKRAVEISKERKERDNNGNISKTVI